MVCDYNQYCSNFETMQPSLPKLSFPPQLPPHLTAKPAKTRQSTKETAREQHREQLPPSPTRPEQKSHITLEKTQENGTLPRQGRQHARRQPIFDEKEHRQFKSLKKVGYLPQAERSDSSRPSRRHKIFDSSYFPQRQVSQQNRKLNHYSSAKNFMQLSQDPSMQLSLKQSGANSRRREGDVRFLSSVPLVEHSRIVMMNSSSQVPEVKSSNRITFTYQRPQTLPLQSSAIGLAQHPQKKIVVEPICTSTVFPVYSPIDSQAPRHSNPVSSKIKKPGVSLRKGTLIDQIKNCQFQPHHPSITFKYPQAEAGEQKIGLGKNIRESLMGGSLASEGLKLGDSFENWQEGSSQRYFDQQQEIPIAQRISYKNIQIPHQIEENHEHHDTHTHNIFSDFDQSRRQERERERQRQRQKQREEQKQRGQSARKNKLNNKVENIPILQQSTLRLHDLPSRSLHKMAIPGVLVGLACLLLLIQMFG